jgi:DNA-binding beta-propeller fold protein YncE
MAYDLKDLSRGPRRSEVSTGRAQSFFYNPLYHELYVLDEGNHRLVVLNAGTLDVKASVPGVHMTAGDSRIVYDSHTDTIIVASEGAYWGSPSDEKGYPIAAIKRSAGQILYTMRDCGGLCIPGLITMHPGLPLAYLAFPKKVLALNTVTRQIAGKPFVSNQWVDGSAITPDGKELLVGVPLQSSVLRFDAESLEPRGAIDTVFGVRTLTLDSERNLLLTASLATNMMDVIDLRTHKRVAKYYLGPWLRSICLDTKNGEAYVSSVQGLFKVEYTARLPQAYK